MFRGVRDDLVRPSRVRWCRQPSGARPVVTGKPAYPLGITGIALSELPPLFFGRLVAVILTIGTYTLLQQAGLVGGVPVTTFFGLAAAALVATLLVNARTDPRHSRLHLHTRIAVGM